MTSSFKIHVQISSNTLGTLFFELTGEKNPFSLVMHREDGSPKDTEKMSAFEVVRSAFTDYLPASPLWSYNSCRIWVKISKQHYHFTLVTSYPINCLRSLSFLSLPHLDNREQKIDLTSILLWLFALFSYKGLRLT